MAQVKKSVLKTLDSKIISPDKTSFSPSSAPELTPGNQRAIKKRLVSIKSQINWLTNIKNTLEYQLAHSADQPDTN